MNGVAFLLILGGGVMLTLGDIVIKVWVQNDRVPFYIGGFALYIVGLIFLAQSFKFQNIATASLALVLANVITLALFSWFYWGEKLSPIEFMGLGLGFISLILLELNAH